LKKEELLVHYFWKAALRFPIGFLTLTSLACAVFLLLILSCLSRPEHATLPRPDAWPPRDEKGVVMSDSTMTIREKAASLVSQMTQREKISFLVGKDQFSTSPLERLSISAVRMTDGPLGVRVQPVSVEGIQRDEKYEVTAFPCGTAAASTWDPGLMAEWGRILAEETRATGCDVLLGPGMNIARNPLNGRTFEYFSEDPYLTAELAVAYVRGLQAAGVGASAKHYACNNFEVDRWRMNAVVEERALREIYLYAFERVVREAQPWTIMNSYNRVNGVYATDHAELMEEIARGEWGFEGLFVSDWCAVHSLRESIEAGCDLEMPGIESGEHPYRRPELVADQAANWVIPESAIDVCCRRSIELALRCEEGRAVFEHPVSASQEHILFARRMAEESIVLLKNDGPSLPLNPAVLGNVALIGPNAAYDAMRGGGSSKVFPPYWIDVADGLREALPAACEIIREAGCGNAIGEFGFSLEQADFDRALEAARKADAVIFCGGYPADFESEGMDRPHATLPDRQDELIAALAEATPNLVVVLNAGGSVEMPWIEEVGAVALAHYPGMEGGRAVASVLTGGVNPGGKLTATYFRRIEDCPAWPPPTPETRDVVYGEGVFVGYRYTEEKDLPVLFPFGHGLSYTEFTYSDLELPEAVPAGEDVEVSLTVVNGGERDGSDVVQIYLRDVESKFRRPKKELKAFQKIRLAAGESSRVTCRIRSQDLCFFDPDRGKWAAEAGEYLVFAGSSSRDIRLEGRFDLTTAT
jgi:beta-glucosidase